MQNTETYARPSRSLLKLALKFSWGEKEGKKKKKGQNGTFPEKTWEGETWLRCSVWI